MVFIFFKSVNFLVVKIGLSHLMVLKMVTVRHLEFSKFQFFYYPTGVRGPKYITFPNVIKIGQTISEISFNGF